MSSIPFDMASDTLAKRLVHDASLLMLPGTMFQPPGNPTVATAAPSAACASPSPMSPPPASPK
jgi:hypothetical protein